MQAPNDALVSEFSSTSDLYREGYSPQEVQVASVSRKQADAYFKTSNFGRALAHLFVALRLIPVWRKELRGIFNDALSGGCKQLAEQGRFSETIPLMKEALLLYPEDAFFLMDLGSLYFKLDDVKNALHYYREALQVCPNLLPASRAVQAVYNKQVERWHFRMLNDTQRNGAYHKAIASRIKEGFASILDVGTGTGLLSLYAAEVGGKQIWACESNLFMVEIAKSVLAANSVSEKINLIHKHSTDISIPFDIPHRVSLLVTEVFDAGLLGEGVLPMLLHAWENLLLPPSPRFANQLGSSKDKGGVVIPYSATVWVAAIQSLHIARRYRLLPSTCKCKVTPSSTNEIRSCDAEETKVCKICGAPCASILSDEECLKYHLTDKSVAANLSEPYTTEDLENIPHGFELLSKPYCALEIDFNNLEDLKVLSLEGLKEKSASLIINTDGSFDAIALWFHLNLDDKGTMITTAPFLEDGLHRGICWHQAIYPLLLPRKVTLNEVVKLCIGIQDGALIVSDTRINSPENLHQLLLVSDEIVSFLNNQTWVKALQTTARILSGKFSCCPGHSKKILDLNPFPILGLEMLRRGSPSWKLYAKAETIADKDFVLSVARENSLSEEQICFTTDENVDEITKDEYFDVICLKVVEPCGELAENLADKILLLNKLATNGIVVPSSLSVKGQFIESNRLVQESRVDSSADQRSVRIAEVMNQFAVDYHLDVPHHALQFKELSHCFEVFNLKLEAEKCDTIHGEFSREILVKAIGTGKATGVIYWVDIVLQPDMPPVSTKCHDSHCNQAVILTSLDMKTDEEIHLKCLYWFGMFDLKVVNFDEP